MPTQKEITVHVQLGPNEYESIHILWFRLPEGIGQDELIAKKFTTNGDAVVIPVRSYVDKDGYDIRLEQILGEEKESLVRWLGEKGFTVRFVEEK